MADLGERKRLSPSSCGRLAWHWVDTHCSAREPFIITHADGCLLHYVRFQCKLSYEASAHEKQSIQVESITPADNTFCINYHATKLMFKLPFIKVHLFGDQDLSEMVDCVNNC